jgi:hypothetical protein
MLPGKSFLSLFSKNTTNIFHNKISGNFTRCYHFFRPGKYLEYFICSTEVSKDFTIKIYPILIFICGRVDTVVHTVHTYVHLTG